ncbi:Zinc finger BED domain-containing protein RICESLEEPER 3, partial [Mucuna pruriens]
MKIIHIVFQRKSGREQKKCVDFCYHFMILPPFIYGTMWKIQCLLMENVRDEDEIIKNVAETMMVKFGKYWDEYGIVLALGAIFDPRIKLKTLGYCYIDPLTWEINLEKVKKKLYMLFSQYSISTEGSTSNISKTSLNILFLPKVLLLIFQKRQIGPSSSSMSNESLPNQAYLM